MRDIDQYEADYRAVYDFERHMVGMRRRKVLERLACYPHARILEVGCGLEPLFTHVDEWREYTIVEPVARFADHARSLGPAGGRVTVYEAFVEDVAPSLANDAFDFIVVSSLLHEVAHPELLLSSIRGLCTAGTVVHLNVPNAASLHNRLAVIMGLIPNVFTRSPLSERMQRSSTFDLASLVALVEREGFAVAASGTYFLKPFTHAQLQRMLEHDIISAQVLDALYEVNADFEGAGAEVFVDLRKR